MLTVVMMAILFITIIIVVITVMFPSSVVVPVSTILAIDLLDPSGPVHFQLADGPVFFSRGKVGIVPDGLDLVIIIPVDLVDLCLPGIGGIVARVGIGIVGPVISTTQDHASGVRTGIALRCIFGLSENDSSRLVPGSLCVHDHKRAKGHQKGSDLFHSLSFAT